MYHHGGEGDLLVAPLISSSKNQVLRRWKGLSRKSTTVTGWHRIDAEGKHALPDKLEAIREAPVPPNVMNCTCFWDFHRSFAPMGTETFM